MLLPTTFIQEMTTDRLKPAPGAFNVSRLYTLIFAFRRRLPDSYVEHCDRLAKNPEWRDDFARSIRDDLGYDVYIGSDLWKPTAQLKRLMNPKCQRCGSREHLDVHHLTNVHLGLEMFYLDELETLCRECHKRAHSGQTPLPFDSDAERVELKRHFEHVMELSRRFA